MLCNIFNFIYCFIDNFINMDVFHMKYATRKIFADVAGFCIPGAYVGARWDGKSIKVFRWKKQKQDAEWVEGNPRHIENDTLQSYIWEDLRPSMEQSSLMNLEKRIEGYHPFSWGFTVESLALEPFVEENI